MPLLSALDFFKEKLIEMVLTIAQTINVILLNNYWFSET